MAASDRSSARIVDNSDDGNVSKISSVEQSDGVRVIHYLGSKLRLLGPIVDIMLEVSPQGSTVCDLFSGSGVVASALARSHHVVATDIQEYSRVLAAGLLGQIDCPAPDDFIANALARPSAKKVISAVAPLVELERAAMTAAEAGDSNDLCTILDSGPLCAIEGGRSPAPRKLRRLLERVAADLERTQVAGPSSLVSRYFGGVYFSWAQAAVLDALLSEAHESRMEARDVAIACVLAAASDIVNSVGKQFAQPIKPRTNEGLAKRHLVQQMVRDRSINVSDAFSLASQRLSRARPRTYGHSAYRADFRDFLKGDSSFDAIYADPPYTRDHYSRYYHVLETMALRDEPAISTTRIRGAGVVRVSRGLYRADRHQSPFSIRSQAACAFSSLFGLAAARGVPIVLSYSAWNESSGNRPRMITMADLIAVARRHFRRVELRSFPGVRHRKLNVEHRNTVVVGDAEQIVICRQ